MEINILEKNFSRTEEILKYLLRIELQKKIEVLNFKIYPDLNKNSLHGYEIVIEFNVLKDVDPDLDYINSEIKKILSQISSFFNQHIIGSNGKLIPDSNNLEIESSLPVISNLEYVYGEKLIVGTLFRVNY
jgi:hypothetical protein